MTDKTRPQPPNGLVPHKVPIVWRDAKDFDAELSSKAPLIKSNADFGGEFDLSLPAGSIVPAMKLIYNGERMAIDALIELPSGSLVRFDDRWVTPKEAIPLWTQKILSEYARRRQKAIQSAL